MLTDYTHLLFSVLMVSAVTLYSLVSRYPSYCKEPRAFPWRAVAIMAVSVALFVAPMAVLLVSDLRENMYPPVGISAVSAASADLGGFLMPAQNQWLSRTLVHAIRGSQPWEQEHRWDLWLTTVYTGNYVFLGVVVWIMALVAALRGKREHLVFWIPVGIAALVLMVGPYVKFFERVYDEVRLPYYYLHKIPVLNISNKPYRYFIILCLSLSVLAGLGITELQVMAANKKRLIGALLGLLICAAIVAERWPAAFQVERMAIPPILWRLRAEQGDFIILNYPYLGFSVPARSMFYQTIHQNPIHWGCIPRLPVKRHRSADDPLRTFPEAPKGTDARADEIGQIEPFVENENIKYILIDRRAVSVPLDLLGRVEVYLHDDFEPLYEDEHLSVYEVAGYRAEKARGGGRTGLSR